VIIMSTLGPQLEALSDIIRHVLWWAVAALVAFGLCWGGGYAAREAWLEVTRTARQRDARSQDRRVEREAARGLAQLERFLDQQPHN
jgi:hypothetical protein